MSIADALEVIAGTRRWAIIHGDCADVIPHLGKVDATVTDPPYGVNLGHCGDPRGGAHGMRHAGYDVYQDTFDNFVNSVVPRLNASIDASTRALVWTGPHIHEQRKPTAIGGVYCPAGAGRTAWGFKSYLPVLLYGASPSVSRGKGATSPTSISSTATPSEESRVGHPCPKPLEWMAWSVTLASDDGDVVFDPFTGSGTTGVAALRLGRRFIGVELSENYARLAREALEAESTGLTLRASRAGQMSLLHEVKK